MIDVVNMNKDKEIEILGKRLGYDKILFREDIKNLNIVGAKSNEINRKALSLRRTDILLNPHLNSRMDPMNSRSSGLNDVLCKLAKKNEVAIGFTFDSIKSDVDLGRIMQNIIFCRKYNVDMVFFTFAKNKYGMKGTKDLLAYLRVIGLGPGEAKSALNNIDKVFEKKLYVRKGLRLVK